MKLKYYLRGLGLGILVTAMILSASGKEHRKELTDSQIKSKAKELGMVEESALTDIFNQEDSVENKNSISNNEITKKSISSNATENLTEVTEEKTDKATDTIKEIAEIENQKIENKEEVTIKVESGESSLSICKKLEKAGLIKSASEFDQYLCQNGYDKKICIGNHKIAMEATNDQIAKAITSK